MPEFPSERSVTDDSGASVGGRRFQVAQVTPLARDHSASSTCWARGPSLAMNAILRTLRWAKTETNHRPRQLYPEPETRNPWQAQRMVVEKPF
eukprot:647351-Rhodomonas_salina.6